MCGITGFVTTGFEGDSRAVVHRMAAALRHRGPDDLGDYVDTQAALGMSRLSIIDLSAGARPIGNENGTVHAVLNGEIYNFRELRARLQARGHRFQTQSDTEVIVHAYEQEGEDFVSDLDGMFALALWDRPQRKLLLARDRMGEKPLYYYDGPGVFVFGSELRALLEHPDVPRELDLQSLSRYLVVEAVPAPHSILAGIAKVPAAHTLVVSPGAKPHLARYWTLPFAPDRSIDEAELIERLKHQLDESVRSRLRSDVPVGVFVSGGIDSYYEYLWKCWVLFGDKDCRDMWDASIPVVHKYLADEMRGELWYGRADMQTGKRTETTYGALDAFFPALLAVSGDLKRASRLQESSFRMWNQQGIEPEEIDYRAMKITSPGYPLRPEIVESTYYLYHYTKDPKYLRMGQTLWRDFVKHCRTDEGYAALKSVITKEKADSMQSFLFAETFKYFYLLFAPTKTLDFDKVIFNTEAHPVVRTQNK